MSDALVFERYGDGLVNTGVLRYAVVPGALHVQFHDERVYVYTDEKPGLEHVERMAELARQGSGLSTYISQRVQHRYARWYRLSADASS